MVTGSHSSKTQSAQVRKKNEDIGKAGALGKESSPKTVSKVAIIHVLYACI